MKSSSIYLALAVLFSFSLQSCLKDSCERTTSYIKFTPVYLTPAEIANLELEVQEPQTLVNPGQIYYYNDHIFIGEATQGIHVIDNTDPHNPVPVEFLKIPGNDNFAIRNGVLYANAYTVLLAVDVDTWEVVGRTDDAFRPIHQNQQSGEILVGYEQVPTTEVMDCETYSTLENRGGRFFDFAATESSFADNDVFAPAGANNSSSVGLAGSMARFAIMGEYLYSIDNTSMELFDLSNPIEPANIGTVDIGWGIETIFPYQDKLFIGSSSGMFIYDNSEPTNPVQLAAFAHARACDPVFVKDNYAYVTLRSGNACAGFVNQLDVIDITELTDPRLKRTIEMDNPHGLSIREEKLFLCEGEYGVKSFDISDPLTLDQRRLDHQTGLHAWDVISLPGQEEVIMVIGDDGFYQYSVAPDGMLTRISKIEVGN